MGRGQSERLFEYPTQIQRLNIDDEKPGCIHWSNAFQ